VEHFLSHTVPNSAWVSALEQAHVAAVRAEIETDMVEAIVTSQVNPTLDVGTVGYLYDPAVVTSADGYGGPATTHDIQPYAATPMRYFQDLSAHSTTPLRAVASGDVAAGGLEGLETLVVIQGDIPADPEGRTVDPSAFASALRGFVEAGGNLVLTDSGLQWLGALGVVPASAVTSTNYNAGHINVDDFTDAYARGLHGTASQTYYEVPLGYSLSGTQSPHWTVTKAAWDAAGGKTVAHVTDAAKVGLGRITIGQGTIGVLGAVLPRPTERWDHFFGLADYAVTVTGGQILHNMLAYGKDAPAGPAAAQR
jgi:hypothetical protein